MNKENGGYTSMSGVSGADLKAFRQVLYETEGDLLAAVAAIDMAAAAEYRGIVAERVRQSAARDAASYAQNIAAAQLRSMGIEHPLS